MNLERQISYCVTKMLACDVLCCLEKKKAVTNYWHNWAKGQLVDQGPKIISVSAKQMGLSFVTSCLYMVH